MFTFSDTHACWCDLSPLHAKGSPSGRLWPGGRIHPWKGCQTAHKVPRHSTAPWPQSQEWHLLWCLGPPVECIHSATAKHKQKACALEKLPHTSVWSGGLSWLNWRMLSTPLWLSVLISSPLSLLYVHLVSAVTKSLSANALDKRVLMAISVSNVHY